MVNASLFIIAKLLTEAGNLNYPKYQYHCQLYEEYDLPCVAKIIHDWHVKKMHEFLAKVCSSHKVLITIFTHVVNVYLCSEIP